VVNLYENYFGYRKKFLHLYKFWSIYLNICMNDITFDSKTPQIILTT